MDICTRLVSVAGNDDNPHTKTVEDLEIPLAEITNGIFRVSMNSYGDDPQSLFLSVTAVSYDLAYVRYMEIYNELKAICANWYQE